MAKAEIKGHESPFPQYPGQIYLPAVINSEDFLLWWEKAFDLDFQEEGTEPDNRHVLFQQWWTRFHLIKAVKMELGENENGLPYEFTEDARKLPTPAIMAWFVELTDPLIKAATDPKAFQSPSTGEGKKEKKKNP